MFLEQGVKPQNKFWKYLLGAAIIILGFSIGQILLDLLVILVASSDHSSKIPGTANRALGYLPPNVTLCLLMITYLITLGVMYLVFRYLHQQTWKSFVTSRVKINWPRILFALSLGAAYWILWYSSLVYLYPAEQKFAFKPLPFALYFSILFILTFIRSLTEQLVYVGYLLQGFANLSKNRWFPLIMVSVISSAIYATHPEISARGFITMFSYQFILSFFLCVITLMDEGIELAVGFCAAKMLINQCFFTSETTALKTSALFVSIDTGENSSFVLQDFTGRFIIIAIFILICSKKYHWRDWRFKLSGKILTA